MYGDGIGASGEKWFSTDMHWIALIEYDIATDTVMVSDSGSARRAKVWPLNEFSVVEVNQYCVIY